MRNEQVKNFSPFNRAGIFVTICAEVIDLIICDEKICVRCLACVTEAEFGGVTFKRGRIIVDESRPEDWQNIFATCPVGAIKKVTEVTDNVSKLRD